MIFIHLAFYLIFILIKRLRTNLCVPDNSSAHVRNTQTCVLPSINYKYQMKWKTIKDILFIPYIIFCINLLQSTLKIYNSAHDTQNTMILFKKNIEATRGRTWNLLIRSQTPYPLGHSPKYILLHVALGYYRFFIHNFEFEFFEMPSNKYSQEFDTY
jgi:hypothetical protein